MPAHHPRALLPALLLLLLAAAPAARAQEPRGCFRPAPADRCTTFWVTELSLTSIVAQPGRLTDTIPAFTANGHTVPEAVITSSLASAFLTWEVGMMRNQGARRALGATVFAAVASGDGDQTRWGVRGRHRWWLRGGGALDLSPGVVFMARPRLREPDRFYAYRRVPGATVQASYSRWEWLGAVAAADLTSDGFGAQLGGRLGSTPGAAVSTAIPVAGILFILLFSDD